MLAQTPTVCVSRLSIPLKRTWIQVFMWTLSLLNCDRVKNTFNIQFRSKGRYLLCGRTLDSGYFLWLLLAEIFIQQYTPAPSMAHTFTVDSPDHSCGRSSLHMCSLCGVCCGAFPWCSLGATWLSPCHRHWRCNTDRCTSTHRTSRTWSDTYSAPLQEWKWQF